MMIAGHTALIDSVAECDNHNATYSGQSGSRSNNQPAEIIRLTADYNSNILSLCGVTQLSNGQFDYPIDRAPETTPLLKAAHKA